MAASAQHDVREAVVARARARGAHVARKVLAVVELPRRLLRKVRGARPLELVEGALGAGRHRGRGRRVRAPGVGWNI